MTPQAPTFPAADPTLTGRFLVRDSTEADMAAIHALYTQAVLTGTASFDADPPSLLEMLARRAALLAHPCPYLVAVEADQVLGFAYAGPYRARHAYRFTVENTVYVAEHAARRGVGTALMHTLIERCRALGYRQMIAVIGGDNPASVALHAACGFQNQGTLYNVGHKFGRWLDSTLMQLDLSPSTISTKPPQPSGPER